MSDEEREWPDPEPTSERERRLKIRLGVGFVAFCLLVVMTRDLLPQALPLLWPPTDPLTQWLSLVFLHLFGYVLVPLMVGSFVTDVLWPRFNGE